MQVEEGNRTKNINITSGKCFHLGYVSAFTVINTQFRKALMNALCHLWAHQIIQNTNQSNHTVHQILEI